MLEPHADVQMLAFLEERLPQVDWTSAHVRPLPVSYTSRFWRVDLPGRVYVVKEFFPGNEQNPLYPTLPDQEADALKDLSRLRVAPDLEDFSVSPSGAPVLVYGYKPPVSDEIDIKEVAALIGRFALLEQPFQVHQIVPAGFQEVMERGDAMLAAIPDSRKAANLKRLRPKDRAGGSQHVRRSLVHRSFCPGTVQATGDGARLIDWQYAGLGDPVEDIACFVSPGLAILYGLPPLVAHAEEVFLKHYPNRQTVDRFLEDRTAYHWRLAAYCLFRSESLMHFNAPAARAYERALEEEVDLLLKLRV